MSKQTIEKAAEKWVFKINGSKWSNNDNTAGDNYGSFIAGAKWQQKEIFKSIKDYEEYIKDHFDPEFSNISFEEWFNNIKKNKL